MAPSDFPTAAPAPVPVDPALDAQLRLAAINMQHGIRSTREDAERILLKNAANAATYLVAVLGTEPPFGGTVATGRIALLCAAMRAREALPKLLTLIQQGALKNADDQRALVARSIAELVDGRDAFDDHVKNTIDILAKDPDRFVRAFAAQAFAAVGDAASIARLTALLNDKDQWVRERATFAKVKYDEQTRAAAAAAAPSTDGGLDFAALAAQAQQQGGTLKAWLDDLSDPRISVRDAAVVALVKVGGEAVPHLLEKLQQPVVRAKIGAALALHHLHPPEAMVPLLLAATSARGTQEDVELRAIALRALAECLLAEQVMRTNSADPFATPTNIDEQTAALVSVENTLLHELVPMSRDPDRFVRAAALLCLGRINHRIAMGAVILALRDEKDPYVLESLAIPLSEGFRSDDSRYVPTLLQIYQTQTRLPRALREALLIAFARSEVTQEAMARDVNGPTEATRKNAIALLENLYTDVDIPDLFVLDDILRRVDDLHPEVRVAAASFLARYLEAGMSGAVGILQKAVKNHERTVQLLCLEALRKHDTDESLQALQSIAQTHTDTAVAARAQELLQNWQPQHQTWAFVAKSLPNEDKNPQTAASTSSATTQTSSSFSAAATTTTTSAATPPKPSRVRAVFSENNDAGGVVEAKVPTATIVEAKIPVSAHAQPTPAQPTTPKPDAPATDGAKSETP